jgi:hypothetical protein
MFTVTMCTLFGVVGLWFGHEIGRRRRRED